MKQCVTMVLAGVCFCTASVNSVCEVKYVNNYGQVEADQGVTFCFCHVIIRAPWFEMMKY